MKNSEFSDSATTATKRPVPHPYLQMGHILALERTKVDMQNQLDDLRHNLTNIPDVTSQCPVCPTAASAVASPVHVETGVVECWDSSKWSAVPGDDARYNDDCHKFRTPYGSAPHVEIGVKSIDHDDGKNVRYDIEVTQLDSNGFCVRCKTWDDSHLFHLWVNWMSIA